MSDTDSVSDDFSSGSAANSVSLADFPLDISSESAASAIAGLRREMRRLTGNLTRRERDRSIYVTESITTTSEPASNHSLPSSAPMEQPIAGSKKPVVALVSALAQTPYHENKETNEDRRTIAYVKVQRAALLFLKTKPVDSLTARTARQWTRSIDPTGNKSPKAKDALRFCYYMRSQGFDVYARFEDQDVLLYIVKQTSNIPHPAIDTLYWIQNFSTNVIKTSVEMETAQFARRNAISEGALTRAASSAPEEYRGLDSLTMARLRAETIVGQRDLRVANRTEVLRIAHARLSALLDSGDADPDAVNAAMEAHQSLLTQSNGQNGQSIGQLDPTELAELQEMIASSQAPEERAREERIAHILNGGD